MDFWDNECRNSLEAEVDIIGSYFRIFYEKFVEIGNQMEKLRKPLS